MRISKKSQRMEKYLNETSALGADGTTGTGTGLTSSMRISKIIWHNFQNYSSTHTITVINIKNKTQSTTWNNLLLRGSDQNLFNIAWLSNNHWGRLLQIQCLIFNIFQIVSLISVDQWWRTWIIICGVCFFRFWGAGVVWKRVYRVLRF